MAQAKAKLSRVEVIALEAMAEAGMTIDAARRFYLADYCPTPRQMSFHAAARQADTEEGPIDISFGGARGGGKTKAVIAQLAIDDCQRQPNLKALFLRKIGKAARESFEDLRRQTLMSIPHSYKHTGVMEFPNGSRIILGHFNAEKDIDAYLGLEYDVIAIEEDTQLSVQKKRDIKTCLRTSKPDWRPRTYRTTNPGGISHADFKEQFVMPWRMERETTTRFIPATVDDNPFVNTDYRKSLESLTGWKRAAWLDGEWDIAAGQFFTTWRYESHVCAPFSIPAHWPVWAALDYGFTHPTACYLFTENDGTVYVAAEHVAAKRLPSQHAADIAAMFARHGVPVARLRRFVAGADVFANKGDAQAKTIAQQYAEGGINLTAASMDRINGWGEVLKLLGDPPSIAPRLQVFNTCVRLIECLPALQHDPHRPEDVLKVDIDDDGQGGDDTADALRYGVAVRHVGKVGVVRWDE